MSNVLWIGGPPGSGKTTVATRLVRRHGLRWYNADARTWAHRDRALAAGNEAAHRWEKLAPAERHAANDEALLAMSLHRERGAMVADDVARLPVSPLTVAEGSCLSPALVGDPARAVWLLPTPAAQEAWLTARDGQANRLYRLLASASRTAPRMSYSAWARQRQARRSRRVTPSWHSRRAMSNEGILATIGNTPMVKLRRIVPRSSAEIWVKLEYRNPTGSMKDRMGLSMIEGAERDGLIEPGTTVVEYTGGSTGPALALVCSAKGYRALIVISECFSEERMQLMRALGAELEVIPAVEERGRVTAQDIRNMVDRAAELAREPGTYATDQFNNPYVIPDHREKLGREIWEQTDGEVTAFCHGIGTAGSLMGISEALKSRTPDVRIVALEPAGSAAISGGPSGSFAMQGWTGVVPPHWDADRVDDVWTIEDAEATAMTLRLAREEGIFAGISTGANVVGALRLAEELSARSVVVTLAVDSGFKYMGGPPYA